MSTYLSGKSRISAQGDFNRYFVQRSDGSGTEVFKHTIVEQDAVFRRQVHDLHQLYSVQKTLMNGSSSNNFDKYNSSMYAAQSYPIPLVSSPSHQPSLMAARSKQLRIKEIPEGRQDLYRNLQHRSLDLQLSADQYISMVDDDPLDLKLSLSLGERSKRKESRNRTRFDRKTHLFPIAVIDLEESTPRKSNRSEIVVIDLEESTETSLILDSRPGPSSSFLGKCERQVSDLSGPIILESLKKDSSQEIVESSCVVDDNGDYPKQTPLNGEYYDDVERKKQTIVSFEGGLFDLNEALPDDASCYMPYPLVDDLNEIFAQDVTNSCSENHKPDELCASEVSLTLSEVKSSINLCEGHGSTHGELKKDETVTLYSGYSLIVVPDGDNSSESSKSRSVSDGDSCSLKTMQSGTHIGTEPNKQEPCKNNDSAQIDCVMQSAAESLIRISLCDAPSHYSAKVESDEMEIEKIVDRPQISIDSYERIAMNLTESNEDEFCASSKPPLEVNEPENQGRCSKLKRGRRLKDFQKDILPGLACLSRHEICEDINILEGVLRSREYRKMRGGDGGNWCSVARSRRSRRRKFL